ncbi:hypothetical protein NQZ68_042426, partial [Dissostichus eleginoides]
HVFHKVCVDPWLNEHCTCPMCKLNILKALGIATAVPCVDGLELDVDRLPVASSSRAPPPRRPPPHQPGAPQPPPLSPEAL